MKYSTLLLALVIFSAGKGLASDIVIKDTIVSQNRTRSYYLYVPERLKRENSVPLVILLHGSGRNGDSLVEKWKELASKEGFIIVGPDAVNTSGWSYPADGPVFLRDIVESLKTKYPIDPRRIYLFGHSAGAVFALLMSTTDSDYFAATAIHAGAFRSADQLKYARNLKRKIPIAIWIGAKDQYFSLAAVYETRDAFKAEGVPVEVTEMPDHDHYYYDLAPKINRDVWAFLKKYELPSKPDSTEAVGPNTTVGPDKAAAQDSGDVERANSLSGEINALRTRVKELVNSYNADELRINASNFVRDHTKIKQIAREEVGILNEAAGSARSVAEKAEWAGGLSSGKSVKYFQLLSQQGQKNAEMFDIMREVSELIVNDASLEAISAKREDVRKRVDQIRKDADELERQATAVVQ